MSLLTNVTGYWKLEDTSDSSGNSLTLTNHNTVAFNPAKILNGADGGSSNTNKDLARDADSPAGITYAQFATGWTINFWCNETTTSAGGHVPVGMQVKSGTNRRQARVEYISNVPEIRVYDGTSSLYSSSTSLSTGTWHMITYGYDGANFFMYIDGVIKINQARSLSAAADSSAGGLGILCDREGGASFNNFSGLVDEVGAWSRVLTLTEILTLYNAGNGLTYPFTSNSNLFFNFL